jgi:hypothetical protein
VTGSRGAGMGVYFDRVGHVGENHQLRVMSSAQCRRLKIIGENNNQQIIACVGKSTLISITPYGRSNKR